MIKVKVKGHDDNFKTDIFYKGEDAEYELLICVESIRACLRNEFKLTNTAIEHKIKNLLKCTGYEN